MEVRLPEIGAGGAIVLAIASLIVGIITGTHWDWWQEILSLVLLFLVISQFGPGELADLAYVPMIFAFIIGCIIGDISWAFQSDTIVINTDGVSNPFSIE